MFNRLIDFSSKRTPQEAFGFYLFYALVTIILCSVAGGIASIFSHAADFHEGFAVGAQVGPFVSGLFCFALSLMVLVKKSLKQFYFVLLPVVAGLLGFEWGCFLGLIAPAYITTIDAVVGKKVIRRKKRG